MPPHKPTVLQIQHEHALIDAGLRLILGGWPEFHVLPAHSPSEQVDAANVVILDHDTALRRPHSLRQGRAHSLVVTTIGNETDVKRALEAGVLGFLSASCTPDEIRMAARVVATGRRYLCAAASLCVADSLARPSLTARESDVLALVSRGRNNKEVARLLGVSVGTVKSHMRALLSKLGAHCRTEAMWTASQRGLIPRLEAPLHVGPATSGPPPARQGHRAPRPPMSGQLTTESARHAVLEAAC